MILIFAFIFAGLPSLLYAMFGGLGMAVGFLLGWFIKWRSGRASRPDQKG